MGEVKPWQIVVIVLAILSAVGMSVYSCASSDTVSQADSAYMVDIATGELFEAPYPKKKAVMFPATNPATGTETLYRVYKREGDKWTLDTRYAPTIRSHKNLKPELVVDWKSGEVRPQNTSPRRAKIFGE
jgi:hypothetical protein